MVREELKSRLNLPVRVFNISIRRLASSGGLVENGPLVVLPGHEIRFNPQQQRAVNELTRRFAEAPFAPPSVKEAQAIAGEDVYGALLDLGQMVQVSSDVVFSRVGYDRLVDGLRELLAREGKVTAGQVRDHFNTSRKYVLAFLEHLDSTGVTLREGDTRRLK
jgi:selenocysteine-specific elongation factor